MTTLLVCLFDELRAVRVVAEDSFNHPDRENELYLWGIFAGSLGYGRVCKGKFHWTS